MIISSQFVFAKSEGILSQETRFEELLKKLKIDKEDVKFKNVFEKNQGRNLYLASYNLQNIELIDQVINEMSAKYPYYNYETKNLQNLSTTQIKGFLTGGFIDSRIAGTSQESQNKVMKNIEDQFERELDIERLKSNLENIAFRNEIFVNGYTGDSGFDLIVDLEIIEKILFAEPQSVSTKVENNEEETLEIDFVKTLSDLISATDENSEEENQTSAENENSKEGTQTQTEGSNPEEDDQTQTEDKNSETNFSGEELSTNPNLCFADSQLQNAFEEYLSENQINAEIDSQENSEENNPNNDNSSENNKAENNEKDNEEESYDETTSDGLIKKLDDLMSNLKGADDWTKSLFCEDFFCLKVSFQNNDDQEDKTLVYNIGDACISCHIQFVLENFYELISHSLIPNKVTGNILEAPKCKKAFAEVSPGMNITLIKKPSLTPKNDELVNNNEDIKKQLKEMFTYKAPAYDDINPTPMSVEEQIAKKDFTPAYAKIDKKLAQLSENSFTSLAADMNKVRDIVEAQTKEKFDKLALEGQIQITADSFQAIEYEMLQMNAYFQSFFDLWNQIGVIEGNPCKRLTEKQNCK